MWIIFLLSDINSNSAITLWFLCHQQHNNIKYKIGSLLETWTPCQTGTWILYVANIHLLYSHMGFQLTNIYLLVLIIFSINNNIVIWKRSENSEKSPSQFPRAQQLIFLPD